MKWKKLGFIFCASGNTELMVTHANSPLAMHLEGDRFRIYFNSRDAFGRARPYFLTIDINEPQKILELNTRPVIELGDLGTFDENGVGLMHILPQQDKLFMYYYAFPRSAKQMFTANSGLAISQDGGITGLKPYPGPIKGASKNEPLFSTVMSVLHENGIYRMYYVSGIKWEMDNDQLKHYYDIKSCESSNGIDWSEGQTAICFKNNLEYAVAKPCLMKDGPNDYKMWYCFRAQPGIDTYRLGYATSHDGIRWERKDEEMGIDVSKDGWDSEMLCYPCVFDHKGSRYLAYNGNGYGKSGFGLAILES